MEKIIDRFRQKTSGFMQGRYGVDQLGWFMLVIALVLLNIGLFGLDIFWIMGVALCAWGVFRSYSRNIPVRSRENERFLEVTEKPRTWMKLQRNKWVNRKTTCYIKCPYCKKMFTVPKGMGKVRAVCPHCHEQSVHKT